MYEFLLWADQQPLWALELIVLLFLLAVPTVASLVWPKWFGEKR